MQLSKLSRCCGWQACCDSSTTRSWFILFNYKGYNSQVLTGIADTNYEFIYFSFGNNGRVSDRGVLEYTDFYDKL